jgi:hypothetical protein
MCGYNLCCPKPCEKPVYGGIYSQTPNTYDYADGAPQTVILDVPMYMKNVTAAVGTMTADCGGYYLVTMSAEVKQTAGNEGDWKIGLTLDDAKENYFTQTVAEPVGDIDRLSKTGIVHIPAGGTISLDVVSTGNPSSLQIDNAHLCMIKIDDEEPVCNGCCCNR